jgi:hypothetical protein
MDEVQKPTDSECCTPSSETFKIYSEHVLYMYTGSFSCNRVPAATELGRFNMTDRNVNLF